MNKVHNYKCAKENGLFDMEEIFHPVMEFPLLDWESLDGEDYGSSWQFHVSEGVGYITIYHKGERFGSYDAWELPESLTFLLQKMEWLGKHLANYFHKKGVYD